MLKPFLLLSAAIVLALTSTPTMGGTPQEASPATATPPATTMANPIKPTPESQAKAKNLYQMDCAMCHGDNGNGQTDVAKGMNLTMPDFTDSKWIAGQTDGQIFDVIRNGKGSMPSEIAGRANDTMVWNLIIYMRNMSKTQPLARAK